MPRPRLAALLAALRPHREYTHLHLLCDWLAAEGKGTLVDYFVKTRHDANSEREANPLYRMAGRIQGKVKGKSRLRKLGEGEPCSSG